MWSFIIFWLIRKRQKDLSWLSTTQLFLSNNLPQKITEMVVKRVINFYGMWSFHHPRQNTGFLLLQVLLELFLYLHFIITSKVSRKSQSPISLSRRNGFVTRDIGRKWYISGRMIESLEELTSLSPLLGSSRNSAAFLHHFFQHIAEENPCNQIANTFYLPSRKE